MKKKITIPFENGYIVINAELSTTNHTYFSITGTTYIPYNRSEMGFIHRDEEIVINGKTYAYDCGGCIHEMILKARPDLKLLVDMHLSDVSGLPMYAYENGKYHLRNGDIEAAANLWRIPVKDAKKMRHFNDTQIQAFVSSQMERWGQEAQQAIALIESL